MTVKRSNQSRATASVPRIGNKNILNRRVRRSHYKIQNLLPQSKVVEVMQHGRVVRRMTVRRKSYYPSGKQRAQY